MHHAWASRMGITHGHHAWAYLHTGMRVAASKYALLQPKPHDGKHMHTGMNRIAKQWLMQLTQQAGALRIHDT